MIINKIFQATYSDRVLLSYDRMSDSVLIETHRRLLNTFNNLKNTNSYYELTSIKEKIEIIEKIMEEKKISVQH